MQTYDKIIYKALPPIKNRSGNERGIRWLWHKSIPAQALWPQCNYCGKFLKLSPIAFRTVVDPKLGIKVYSIRECAKCHTTDYRPYYGEDGNLQYIEGLLNAKSETLLAVHSRDNGSGESSG